MTESLLRLIPTHELPLLVAAFEEHARRNYDRTWDRIEPNWVLVFSQNEGARYSAEARRCRWAYLDRLAHERASAL